MWTYAERCIKDKKNLILEDSFYHARLLMHASGRFIYIRKNYRNINYAPMQEKESMWLDCIIIYYYYRVIKNSSKREKLHNKILHGEKQNITSSSKDGRQWLADYWTGRPLCNGTLPFWHNCCTDKNHRFYLNQFFWFCRLNTGRTHPSARTSCLCEYVFDSNMHFYERVRNEVRV